MSSYPNVFVEGTDDKKLLDQLFVIEGEFKPAGNKKKTRKFAQVDESSYGIVDRDFDSEADVHASRGASSRCATLSRYCLENYLINSQYLYEFAVERNFAVAPCWDSPESIERFILAKAQELCHHAAANEQLAIFNNNIAFHELRPYFVKPQEQPVAIQEEMQRRVSQLPSRQELDAVMTQWEKRCAELLRDCQTLEGVNRWINGKILLREVLYQAVIDACPAYAQLEKKYFVEDLAQIAKQSPPPELIGILQGFGVRIL